MRAIVIALALAFVGCDELANKGESHPAMPNQIEVGSVIADRYKITKRVGVAGDYDVFAVDHVTFDRSFTLLTPRTPNATPTLVAAAKRPATQSGITVNDFGTLPDERVYAIITVNDRQLRELMTGTLRL